MVSSRGWVEKRVSEEEKKANLEHALELACRDAVEECDRARSAEARVQQLEEARRFYAEEENWQGVWWRGAHIVSVAEQDGGDKARAALIESGLSLGSISPSEAPASKPWGPATLQDKERCVHTYSEGPGAPCQRCALKKDHYGWHAWGEASEATRSEKEGEDG